MKLAVHPWVLPLAVCLSSVAIAVLAYRDARFTPFLTNGLAEPAIAVPTAVTNTTHGHQVPRPRRQPLWPRPPSGPPTIRFLSYSPIIIHVQNFISPEEGQYLLDLASPLLQPSRVLGKDGVSQFVTGRSSSSAYLPYSDPITTRIAKRLAEFQGYQPRRNVDVQVTAYSQGQYYAPHFDWFGPDRMGPHGQRFSTLFLTLEASCEKCGTQFGKLPTDWTKRDRRWCQFVDCEEEVLTTKSRVGEGVFWINLDEDGKGRQDVLHAGLPVRNGTKTGLNIWTKLGDRFD